MKVLNIEQTLVDLAKRSLAGEEVGEILRSPNEFPVEIAEKIALLTAVKYWNKEISFLEGDCIINNLFVFWVTNDYFVKNYPFTDTLWECYLAFDAGEYYRSDDDRALDDPPEKYTKPLIKEMLQRIDEI